MYAIESADPVYHAYIYSRFVSIELYSQIKYWKLSEIKSVRIVVTACSNQNISISFQFELYLEVLVVFVKTSVLILQSSHSFLLKIKDSVCLLKSKESYAVKKG